MSIYGGCVVKMGATIKDIAQLSGVGISTVSRVLNSSGSASKETREKVIAAAKELKYVPNNNARNLKMVHSKTILLLAKSIVNPFFQEMIKIIQNQIMLRGYSLDIQNIDGYEDEMALAKQKVLSGNPCALVLMGGCFGYEDADFISLGIPCVLATVKAADTVDENLYSSVLINDKEEMASAVAYLIGLGHKRIGCIYNNYEEAITPNKLRFEGYKMALERNGIPFDPFLVSSPKDTFDSGYKFGFNMMKYLMERNPDMTAVVTMADIMAIGAAKAVLSSGRKIPDDISIVGFDGIEVAEYYHPALDTIAQPVQLMAQQIVEAVMEMLDGGKTSHVILKSNLVKRGSCKAV